MPIEIKTLTEKQLKRYHRIIDIAEGLMFQYGAYKLSLTDITGQLNISRSTIYDFFGSKEGLIEAVVKNYDDKIEKGVVEQMEDQSLSAKEKFVKIADYLVHELGGKDSYLFLNDLKHHYPESYEIITSGRKRRQASCYFPLVQEGMEQGIFAPTLKIDFILHTYIKLTQLVCDTDLVQQVGMTKPDTMKSMIDIFLKGTAK